MNMKSSFKGEHWQKSLQMNKVLRTSQRLEKVYKAVLTLCQSLKTPTNIWKNLEV